MDKILHRKLFSVRWRCSLNRLLENVCEFLFFAAIAAMVLVISEKILGSGLIFAAHLILVAAAGILAAMVWWQIRRPGRLQLAILLDERAKLAERTSSIIAFEKSSDPFAQAAVDESRHTISAIKPGKFFPLIKPSKLLLSIFSGF